jgi:hypothetical protein
MLSSDEKPTGQRRPALEVSSADLRSIATRFSVSRFWSCPRSWQRLRSKPDARHGGDGRVAGSAILAFAIVFRGICNENGAGASKAVMVAGFAANGFDCLVLLHATATGL